MAVAVLVACAATGAAVGSKAQSEANEAEGAWKVRIVKDKTAAPSKASAAKASAQKGSAPKEAASKEAAASTTEAISKEGASKEKGGRSKAGALKEKDGSKAGASKEKNAGSKAAALKEKNAGSKAGASKEKDGGPQAGASKEDDGGSKAAASKEKDGGSQAGASKEDDGGSKAAASKEKDGASQAGASKEDDGGSKAAASKEKDGATKAGAPKGGVPWYRPVKFKDLPGWERDDHLIAFQAFLKSCGRVIARARDSAAETDSKRPQVPPAALAAVCTRATAQAGEITTKEAARAFFEQHFTPNTVVKKGQSGLLTGYYEPVLQGSRTPDGPYQTPIYKRPPDLVNTVDDTRRGALKAGELTHVRKTATGTEPYFTRAEIDGGALKGKGLELLYFTDPVEVFFMQIQGSGRVKLTDGTTVRVHYDGKNGHPYSSIGRYLIEKAILAADRMSMAALAQWLRADPERGRKIMWQNSSYVFFREIKDDVGSPLGAMRVPLTPERSLAIDPSYHALGTPIYLSVPTMKHVPGASPFNRLMVGQDVGSAIRGPERGDIYFGSGDEAGRLAGGTRYTGRFFVLVPNSPLPATAAVPAPQKAQE